MKKIQINLLACAVATAALAGCGGGGSDAPSGALGDYQTQFQEALVPLGAVLRDIGVASTASGKQLAIILDDAKSSVAEAQADVDALDPPSEVKAPNDELVQSVDEFAKRVQSSAASPAAIQSLVTDAKDFATNLGSIEKELADKGVDSG
jgi:hypothetical protein